MATERCFIEVAGIRVEVVRKAIKNLHLGVYPPEGRVRVAAPERLDDEAVRLAVVTRLGWIRRQQAGFAAQARQSPRQMLSGESHYFMGHRYRLRVMTDGGPARIEWGSNRYLVLHVPPDAGREAREKVLYDWYRAELKRHVARLIVRWEPLIGVRVAHWGIRRMKTRWGSCNSERGRILLNLELAKAPPRCIQYIVVHEMTHLLERTHGARFQALMDGFLPNWRGCRAELNRAPLCL